LEIIPGIFRDILNIKILESNDKQHKKYIFSRLYKTMILYYWTTTNTDSNKRIIFIFIGPINPNITIRKWNYKSSAFNFVFIGIVDVIKIDLLISLTLYKKSINKQKKI